MKTNKKIDQVFRDKFQGVETTPPADVWQNIATRLPEKKERKLLPFLYQLGGAAAAIALIFFLFNLNSTPTENKITNSNIVVPTTDYKPNISSEAFDELMTNSSNILNAAVMDTRIEVIKAQLVSQTSAATPSNSEQPQKLKSNNRENVLIADISEEKEYQIANSDINSETKSEGAQPTSDTSEAIADISAIESEKNDLANIASANIAEKEVKEKETAGKRFSVTPTAAAIYFDTGKGNALDNQFAGTNGSGEISMSYGINLAYQISDKIKVRSGVNSVNLNYNTRNVDYASARNSSAVTTQENAIIQTSSVNGSLNQDFSFLEIPVEVEYILIDKKLGLNLIGGASTFFLEENNIVLESPNFTAEIGEANNLNKTSFSANLGVGMNYDISPQFRFNLEPIFKYQINTFNSSSNLNSYYFGIYSGLSFKF